MFDVLAVIAAAFVAPVNAIFVALVAMSAVFVEMLAVFAVMATAFVAPVDAIFVTLVAILAVFVEMLVAFVTVKPETVLMSAVADVT